MQPILRQVQQQRLQQVLAPQLRQSLEFLQVPLLELRSLIQRELEQNPTIEEHGTANEPLEPERPEGEGAAETPDPDELEFRQEYEVLARLDDEWREYFQQAGAARPYTADDESRRQFLLDSLTQAESLQEHLCAQLGLLALEARDRGIATLLIGSINDDGYLNVTLGELAETSVHDVETLERVLRQIQEMDPVGVGARDLRECLGIQLDRLGLGESVAAAIVRDHIEALGARRHEDIARALRLPVEEVERAARLIATLEPRPGRAFGTEAPAYVPPEVIVRRSGEGYAIQLANERLPRVRISRHYRRLMEDPNTPAETRAYIRDKIRAGVTMIRSIHQRQQTIGRIAEEIVRVQRDFLDHGVSRLRPLTMSEIAGLLGVHETTVSRAIANKYMQTPRGTFEMKYFFRPGYRSGDGEEVANISIQERVREMIAGEDPAAPLSDQALADRLRAEGLSVARRTIAKYRDELRILPSHLRRERR